MASRLLRGHTEFFYQGDYFPVLCPQPCPNILLTHPDNLEYITAE